MSEDMSGDIINKKMIEYDNAVYSAFNTGDGKKVLDYLKKNHLLRSNFSSDPYQMAFWEGQRSIVLTIVNTIERIDNPQTEEL
jgi:hypothetical protein